MSLGGQELLNAIAPSSDGSIPVSAYSSGGKGGALTPEQAQALQYYVASQPAVINAFSNEGRIVDPTLLAQQAILARPMRQTAYQPLLSRYVTSDGTGTGGTGGGTGAISAPRPSYTGLMYPSVQRPSISVPSYTSRYAGTDSGGGGGTEAPAGGGYVAVPDYSIPVSEMGTYVGNTMIDPSTYTGVGNPGESAFNAPTSAETGIGNPGESYGGYTSSESGIGNPGESYGGGYTSSDTGVGNPGESDSGGYGGYGDSGGYGGDSGGYGGDSGGGDSGGGSSGSDGNGWAKGGKVTKNRLKGKNPRGPDDGYGALEDGEYVIRKKAVQKYGDGLMSMINSGKY